MWDDWFTYIASQSMDSVTRRDWELEKEDTAVSNLHSTYFFHKTQNKNVISN